ncbi:MAG: hypothetical protein ACYTBV_19760 [Planctomycetota bacterium]|jgi:hypothetical protein
MYKKTGITNIEIIAGVVLAILIGIALASVLLWDTYGEKGSGLGKDFLYDLKELGKIDPALITYEESAQPLNSGLKATRAIAVGPNDDIYIAGDNAVSKVAPQGTDRIVELAEMPRCLAVTADGNIYVGLKDHIEIFDDKGKQMMIKANRSPDGRALVKKLF